MLPNVPKTTIMKKAGIRVVSDVLPNRRDHAGIRPMRTYMSLTVKYVRTATYV